MGYAWIAAKLEDTYNGNTNYTVSSMLIVSECSVTDHNRAGRFASLMDLYERNYIGLRRLAPQLPQQPLTLCSQVPGGLDLYLQLIERHRYTTDIVLTYRFAYVEGWRAEPNLGIRIYHDARQAEVMSAQLRHWAAFESTQCDALHQRWRVNRFLWKWLNYCLYQGHCFPPSSFSGSLDLNPAA